MKKPEARFFRPRVELLEEHVAPTHLGQELLPAALAGLLPLNPVRVPLLVNNGQTGGEIQNSKVA